MPVRLHEKILECEEPVVGLDHILELLPESDPEVHILFYFFFRPRGALYYLLYPNDGRNPNVVQAETKCFSSLKVFKTLLREGF